MLAYVLDTSAWIAHILQEPGWETVSTLLRDGERQVGISALSLIELYGSLRTFNQEKEFEHILEGYRDLLLLIIPIDEAIALRAIALRQKARARVPAIDSLIAATAAHHNAILVHRDPHFLPIAAESLQQLHLG